MLADEFAATHWGVEADREFAVRIPKRGRVVGSLVSISYATAKGGQRGVWEHVNTWRPALHLAAAGELFPADRAVIELGQVIDLIIERDQRVIIVGGAGLSVVYTPDRLWWGLASTGPAQSLYQVGVLPRRVQVTDHGIIT